jgi:hypothetical protein
MPSRKFPKHTLITALIMLFVAVVITYKNVEGFQTTATYNILAYLEVGSLYFVTISDSQNVYTLSQQTPFSFNARYDTKVSLNLNNYPSKITTMISQYAIDFGSKAQQNLDNRMFGTGTLLNYTPAYWFVQESKTNYKFSSDLTLNTTLNKYITTINNQTYTIQLYDYSNTAISASDLPSTIPAGVGHMKFVAPSETGSGIYEWRYSVQLKSGWKYVKLRIDEYTVPATVLVTNTGTGTTTGTTTGTVTGTVTGGTTGGTSPPAGSSAPSDSPNYLLIGTGIAVGVVMLSFLFRR